MTTQPHSGQNYAKLPAWFTDPAQKPMKTYKNQKKSLRIKKYQKTNRTFWFLLVRRDLFWFASDFVLFVGLFGIYWPLGIVSISWAMSVEFMNGKLGFGWIY